MKEIHRQNTEVRKHYTVSKISSGCKNAKLLYAGELKKTSNWEEQMHSHAFCEIIYVKSGTGILHTNNATTTIREGDLLLYNLGTLHSESSADNDELALFFCGIDRLKLQGKPENALLDTDSFPVFRTGALKCSFESYFSDLIREVSTKPYYYDEISHSLIMIILNMILRLLAQQDESYFSTNESYLTARKFIDDNYEKIESLDDISRSVYISRYYLAHLFKEYGGVSPIQYVIAKRMEKAKKLLLETALSVREIALQTGYAEVASFLKTFKKTERMTPSEFRKTQKS